MLEENEINELKKKMIKKYKETNYTRLCKEIKVSRQSLYRVMWNRKYCLNIEKKIREWIKNE